MTTPDPRIPGYPQRLILTSLGVLALGFVILAANWPFIPDPVPVHFSADGPDRWEPKTWWSVTFLRWGELGVLALFAGIAALGAAAHRSMPVDPARGGVPAPFSRSLADRLAYQLGHLGRGLGVLGLILSAGMTYAAVATTIPAFGAHLTASIVVILLGPLGGGLVLVVLAVRAMFRSRELFPPDEDEKARHEFLGAGPATAPPGGGRSTPHLRRTPRP
ncbi:DUF1648 domain-containing protein [Corynebacterium halotolerans]|uniref:DUF1648 domain-containing protein n=1 Tax=Corynebacterium halotolerans TaxID=225326 RepID=UPI00047C539C|nr:DUF1648 domain-containing protein [Corynebacterium halotolerans]